MTQTTQADRATKPPSNMIPPELAAMGKKRLEEFVAMQTEQLEKLQEMNQSWFDRMQSEAALASEFTTKLTAVYQEWATRHMEMAAEDGKRFLADGQKLAETGARLLSNGWQANGHGGST